jgi:RimJ/RimL family protein N-acetyltransferase
VDENSGKGLKGKLISLNSNHHDKEAILVSISALDDVRYAALESRVAPWGEADGPTNRNCWKSPAAQQHLYAVERRDREIVGVVYLNTPGPASPGWWIDPDFRGFGFGVAAIDAIANMMIERRVRLGQVIINHGPDADASRILLCHLKTRLQNAGFANG